jgi:hypothetical protein
MLKIKYKRFRTIFNQFWERKIFKFAVLIQITYVILALIITLIFFEKFNDFLVYYKVGNVFIQDIESLYDPINYEWPFRYFPLSAVFFIPFSFFPFEIAFILFTLFNALINFLICLVLYKIINLIQRDQKKTNHDNEKTIFYISLYLIALPHIYNYILGQINLLVSVFLLSSLYIFLKYKNFRWNVLAGLLIGVSINIKPITILIIPFLISFSLYDTKLNYRKEVKKSIVRIFGALVPLLINGLLFLLIPELFKGFLEINFTGTETLIVNNSFSITKLIINALTMFGYDIHFLRVVQFLLFLIVLAIIGGVAFLLYLNRKLETNSIVYGFIFGITTILLAYFDSWDHHLLILIPLIIISIFSISTNIENNENKRKFMSMEKKILYFFLFIDLPIFGLIFILRNIFPYNFIPTIFLLLLYGVNGKLLMEIIKL